MFKKTISMLLMVAFSLNVLFILPVLAGHRIQDQGGGTVTLDARGGDFGDNRVPENATGEAKFDIDKSGEGVSRMKVTVKVENLPERAQRVYEVWLIDGSGSDINLTSFNTDNDGNATAMAKRNIINLAPYDRIVISTKRIESFQTSRGPTVMSGVLHRGSSFDDDFDDTGDNFDDSGDFGDDFDDSGDNFDDSGDNFDDTGDDFDSFDDDFNGNTFDDSGSIDNNLN